MLVTLSRALNHAPVLQSQHKQLRTIAPPDWAQTLLGSAVSQRCLEQDYSVYKEGVQRPDTDVRTLHCMLLCFTAVIFFLTQGVPYYQADRWFSVLTGYAYAAHSSRKSGCVYKLSSTYTAVFSVSPRRLSPLPGLGGSLLRAV